MAIKVRHDPTAAIEAHAALTRYVEAVEIGDHDADELTGLLSRAYDAVEVEVHALRRSLGR